MKKITSVMLVVVLVLSLMAGCSKQAAVTSASSSAGSATAKLSGKITFVTHRTDLADLTLKAAANEFEQDHPNTNIEIEALSDPKTVLQTRLAANELPDITMVYAGQKDWATYYMPLGDLGFNAKNLRFYNTGLGTDSKLYEVTSSVNYYGIVYSKLAFRKAGITSTPTTMADFTKDCDLLKAASIIPVGTNYKDAWPLTYYTFMYAIQQRGDKDYLNNMAKTDTPLSDDHGTLEGIQWLRSLVKKGYTESDLMSTNWDLFKSDFAKGKYGMTFMATWLCSQVVGAGGSAEDIGSFAVPESKGVYINPDKSYAIAKSTKNPNLAKAYFKYMFMDGKYASACSVISPIIGGKTTYDQYVTELLKSNSNVIEYVSNSDDYTAIANKAQWSWTNLAQEYVTASDPNAVVTKYNGIWASAKKSALSK
jgi:raffinose/stachyose/melibiose transport system substrate-binding protein